MDICGICGEKVANDYGLCANCGADYWVGSSDFYNPDLEEYIKTACNNLEISKEQLMKLVHQQEKRIRIVCGDCGSENVVMDACAKWDYVLQEWVLAGFQDNATCNDCGSENTIEK